MNNDETSKVCEQIARAIYNGFYLSEYGILPSKISFTEDITSLLTSFKEEILTESKKDILKILNEYDSLAGPNRLLDSAGPTGPAGSASATGANGPPGPTDGPVMTTELVDTLFGETNQPTGPNVTAGHADVEVVRILPKTESWYPVILTDKTGRILRDPIGPSSCNDQATNQSYCVLAGTKVLMDNGEYVNVEDVNISKCTPVAYNNDLEAQAQQLCTMLNSWFPSTFGKWFNLSETEKTIWRRKVQEFKNLCLKPENTKEK
jgi:hypothetical protein